MSSVPSIRLSFRLAWQARRDSDPYDMVTTSVPLENDKPGLSYITQRTRWQLDYAKNDMHEALQGLFNIFHEMVLI